MIECAVNNNSTTPVLDRVKLPADLRQLPESELRALAEDLNADLDVTGINGSVNPAVGNVTILGKLDRQNFHAKIGGGGSPIKVSGINGHVKLSRVGSPG